MYLKCWKTSGIGSTDPNARKIKILVVFICIMAGLLLASAIFAYVYFIHPFVMYFTNCPNVQHGIEYYENGVDTQDFSIFQDALVYYGFSQYDVADFYYVDNSKRCGNAINAISDFYVVDFDAGESRQEVIDDIATTGIYCGNLDQYYNQQEIEVYLIPGDRFSLRDHFVCAFSRETGYIRFMMMTESVNLHSTYDVILNIFRDSAMEWNAISGE